MIIKPVPGYPAYFATDTGQIISTSRNTHKVLKQRKNDTGYLRVSVMDQGKKVSRMVHVMVLLAFKGDKPVGTQTAHLDGIRTNNLPMNLSWVTPSENMTHKWLHGTQQIGSKNSFARLTEDDVQGIKQRLNAGVHYRQLAAEYAVSARCIQHIQYGTTWGHVNV